VLQLRTEHHPFHPPFGTSALLLLLPLLALAIAVAAVVAVGG
jgi:hypothetical protein